MEKFLRAPALAVLALVLSASALQAQGDYRQQNLVSDIPGLAVHTDPNLVNPWGIAASATSPFWVSNAGTGTATLYNTSGTPIPLVVNIPHPSGGAGEPTGQVFNTDVSAFNGDRFIFASALGTIAGWRGALGTTAETLVNNSASGAAYLGVATATEGTTTRLYVANFGGGTVDVFDSALAPILPGSFADATLPSGYAPFNIQQLGTSLYVTYALVSPTGDEVPGAGLGFVNKFDFTGNLEQRLVSNGALNAPWGLALAPDGFGRFGGNLLVGNFGDGTINAFDPVTGDFIGTLKDEMGNPLVNEGLWGLRFGNGGNGGKLNTLYFAAGIDGESHGLFGSITPVPEPSTYAAFAAVGLLALVAHRRFRRIAPATV